MFSPQYQKNTIYQVKSVAKNHLFIYLIFMNKIFLTTFLSFEC